MNNRKYERLSFYCPEDKDIYDFLSAKAPSIEQLEHFLRGRGIFCPQIDRSNIDDIRAYISELPLDWKDLSALIDLVDVRESSDNVTYRDVKYAGPIGVVVDAVKEVEDLRSMREGESYTIVNSGYDNFSVRIDYMDSQAKFTRMIQRWPVSIMLYFEKKGDELLVRYTNNATALAIVTSVEGKLAELSAGEKEVKPLVSSELSLESVLSTRLRVKFFRQLVENLPGFEYQTVTDVRIERLPKALRTKVPEQDDEDADTIEAERIRKVILNGKDLCMTDDFKKYVDQGFFISSVSWQSLDEKSGELIDFRAGFEVPGAALGFQYRILGKHIAEDGEHESVRIKVIDSTARIYYQTLEEAAKAVHSKILEESVAQGQ